MTKTYKVRVTVQTQETVEITAPFSLSNSDLKAVAAHKLGISESNISSVFAQDITPIPRTVKERIRTAFQKLRKVGAIARMNYMCCSSCGWAQMESDYPNRQDGDTAVFYHRQDAESFDEKGNLGRYRDWNAEGVVFKQNRLYLAFAGDGDLIVGALQSEGLLVEWNGDVNKKIAVIGVREGSL